MMKVLDWNSPEARKIFEERCKSVQEEERKRKEWQDFVRLTQINDLSLKAKELFEEIQGATKGVFRFEPMYSIRDDGGYRYVARGRKKGFFPIGWYIVDENKIGLGDLLHKSSDVETAIWRKLIHFEERFQQDLEILGGKYAANYKTLNKTFSTHDLQRDFSGSYNGMPRHIESAFNHIFPEIPFRVIGFEYPHKESKIQFD